MSPSRPAASPAVCRSSRPCTALAAALIVASATAAPESPARQIKIDNDDIAGIVTSSKGPEAGVWVIAETNAFATRYAKIVVTDDRGRYLIPDLPAATYKVWVRGYGLTDSTPVQGAPGKHLDLTAVTAPDAATAARVYPAAYWYAMLKLPQPSETAQLHGGRNEYLMWIKNMGC
ncbi:MAG TPA: carboxypeptidase-like regulatory domain-containing protein, partial [Steroidobacteraceae bacterium]|nr:carboxypeptidase-like regulatory domain-containing protein [Steroidobacteraceae bacterium]